MHLKKIGMYQTIPGGICLRGETVLGCLYGFPHQETHGM